MLLILDAQFFFVSSSFNGNLPNQFLPTTKPKKGRHKGHGQKVLSFALRRHKVLPPNPPFVFFFSFFFFRTPRTTTTVVSCVVSDTFWTLVARDDALSFSLSLLSLSLSWGSLSLSLARKRREERTRARSESNTASRRVSRAGRCIRARARARGKTVTRVLCSRESKRESLLVSPSSGTKASGKRKERFSVTARSRARALVSRTDYLSIHRSIDRLEKKSKNDGRVCARAAFWSRVAARRR